MYRRHDVMIRREDIEKAFRILMKLENDGDVDRWSFIRWNGNTVCCSIAPIISDDLGMIKDKFLKAGIQIL